MRKILFIFTIIELSASAIYCNITDSLLIYHRGFYTLSYANISKIFNITPDSIKSLIKIDSLNGFVKLNRDLKDTVLLIINYNSKDEFFSVKRHKPAKIGRITNHPNSIGVGENGSDISEDFINGLNVINISSNDYNGFKVNTSANNHFNYNSPGGITVSGYINDNNKIFSGEGAYLSDISGLNISVYKGDTSLSAGDISYTLNGLNQKMTGMEFIYGKKIRVLAGLDGGVRGSKEFEIESGNLGPYNIIPPGDTLYYISPNSERVFLNGHLLTNGMDYTINYSYGNMTFLPRIKLNTGDRVYLTYQLKSRYNLRHYIHIDSKLNNAISVEYDETRDWKRNVLGLSYDSTLYVSDTIIIINGAKYVGNKKGNYEKNGNLYNFVGIGNGDYNCYFTFVGDSLGDYAFDNVLHGFKYVGYHKGSYLPEVRVHPPSLRRSITMNFLYHGLKEQFNVMQVQNNLLSGYNNFNLFGMVSYGNIIKTVHDTTNFITLLKWFNNVKYNDFSNDMMQIKSDFHLNNDDSLRNVFLPEIRMNYKYKNNIVFNSRTSELVSRKIINTGNNIRFSINKMLYTSGSFKYLSESQYNNERLRSNILVGIRNRDFSIEFFTRTARTDTGKTIENGINLKKSVMILSVYKKFTGFNTSMNYNFLLDDDNGSIRLYLNNCENSITHQFEVNYSKKYDLVRFSVSGDGGNYKPFFLVPHFIQSPNGDYDYDSLNNVYYPVKNGHYIKEEVYKQSNTPLQTYDIRFSIISNEWFTFNNYVNIKRNYVEIGDSIKRNDNLSVNTSVQKQWRKRVARVNANINISDITTSNKISGELTFRTEKSELYTLDLTYNYYTDQTPFLRSKKEKFIGFFSYGTGFFNIKFFNGLILYAEPEHQRIIHTGVGMSFNCHILNSLFTITPLFAYNIYADKTSFAEINEDYPEGIDVSLGVDMQHKLTDNTMLNFNFNGRYNTINGFFKSFNLSIGVNL